MKTNMYSETEAAKYLGLSVKTLQMRRHKHQRPIYIKFGKSVRYRREDLDAYIEACRIDPERRGRNDA